MEKTNIGICYIRGFYSNYTFWLVYLVEKTKAIVA